MTVNIRISPVKSTVCFPKKYILMGSCLDQRKTSAGLKRVIFHFVDLID